MKTTIIHIERQENPYSQKARHTTMEQLKNSTESWEGVRKHCFDMAIIRCLESKRNGYREQNKLFCCAKKHFLHPKKRHFQEQNNLFCSGHHLL
jgi:hypothetical protein